MIILWLIVSVCGLLLLLEIGLRWGFGFGNPLLYIADNEIGYLLAPSQRTRRMGNRIEINQYSMRSPFITPKRPKSTLRILLLGDSVAGGGWWTDQEQTISALLSNQLKLLLAETDSSFEAVEVLNASANSWGPPNQLAYLKRFGTFEAQAVVLLINTDDLFATAPTSAPVGRDRNYPHQKPRLAITEILQRYVFRASMIPEMQVVNSEKGVSVAPPEEDRVGFNLEAIRQINHLSSAVDAKLLLALTPLLREIGQPGSRDYELEARRRLEQFTQDQAITYLDLLKEFDNTLYRDHIHLSPQGNQKVTEAITQSLQLLLPQILTWASTTPATPQ